MSELKMFKSLSHLGIAVRNLEEALKLYRDTFGLPLGGVEEIPSAGVKVAFLQVGEVRIELLEPLSPEGAIGKFIEKHGPGFHHIAYKTEDIEKALETLKKSGCVLIDEKPRTGAHGTRVAFIHPKSCGGVLTELVEEIS
jgi:methylmalonyl-CoA/ethylmalonyl-CoA epimerase